MMQESKCPAWFIDNAQILAFAEYLVKNGVRCMPFIAMIEKTTENGAFCQKQREQNHNGRYCVVYEDKSKWGTPLIDICGRKAYDKEEAFKRLGELCESEKKA